MSYLAHLRTENEAFYTDEIADIEQFLENDVVHLLLHGGRLLTLGNGCLNIVTGDIDLNTALGVLNLDERGLAHDALGHQSSCNPHFFAVPLIKMRFDVRGVPGYFILGSRVGINPHVSHRLQALPPYLFLFT